MRSTFIYFFIFFVQWPKDFRLKSKRDSWIKPSTKLQTFHLISLKDVKHKKTMSFVCILFWNMMALLEELFSKNWVPPQWVWILTSNLPCHKRFHLFSTNISTFCLWVDNYIQFSCYMNLKQHVSMFWRRQNDFMKNLKAWRNVLMKLSRKKSKIVLMLIQRCIHFSLIFIV